MTDMTLAQKVAMYIQLRNHKKKADDEYKKSIERVNLAMGKLEAELLQDLQEQGAESARSEAGTVYIRSVATATVNDRDQFMHWLKANGEWEALDVRANKAIVRELMGKGEVIPGITYTEVATVGVRKS